LYNVDRLDNQRQGLNWFTTLILVFLHAGAVAALFLFSWRAFAVAGLVAMQAAIGIVTLVLAVPLWAGLLHQAFAMLVLGMAVAHAQALSQAR